MRATVPSLLDDFRAIAILKTYECTLSVQDARRESKDASQDLSWGYVDIVFTLNSFDSTIERQFYAAVPTSPR